VKHIDGSVVIRLKSRLKIDQGSNPNDYSRKLIEKSQMSAKRAEEKQRWVQTFKNALDLSITRTFGDLRL
jgi:hypothetical protein